MEVDPYNSKLYSNRCTAYLLLENYDKAMKDAEKCVSIDLIGTRAMSRWVLALLE